MSEHEPISEQDLAYLEVQEGKYISPKMIAGVIEHIHFCHNPLNLDQKILDALADAHYAALLRKEVELKDLLADRNNIAGIAKQAF